jgi:hypothetical protein
MSSESNRDIFDSFTHLILASILAFALTWGLGWLRGQLTFYDVVQVIFYVVDIIIIIETLRRDRYACIGYAIGLVVGVIFFGITFSLPELLIYSLAVVIELFRLRTGTRS